MEHVHLQAKGETLRSLIVPASNHSRSRRPVESAVYFHDAEALGVTKPGNPRPAVLPGNPVRIRPAARTYSNSWHSSRTELVAWCLIFGLAPRARCHAFPLAELAPRPSIRFVGARNRALSCQGRGKIGRADYQCALTAKRAGGQQAQIAARYLRRCQFQNWASLLHS